MFRPAHTVLVFTILLGFLFSTGAQACLSPYGFKDFEPKPLVAPGGNVEMAPVDISASSVDDMNARMISYKGELYSFWVKETGTTEVSENIMCRVLRDGDWTELWAVNNAVPEEGSFEGPYVRVAGYDLEIHEGLLWVVWSTPNMNYTDGTDNDIVYRTYDGSSWSPVHELLDLQDTGEDVQPTLSVTPQGLLVVWTTNNPDLCDGKDQDIVSTLVGDALPGDVVALSQEGDSENDFIPEMVRIPGGTYLTWYTRKLVIHNGRAENVVVIQGREYREGDWSGIQMVSPSMEGENIWVSMLWDGTRLCFAWQRSDSEFYYRSSVVFYREWSEGDFGPLVDLTSILGGSFNGRPELGMVGDEVRAYWHTNDDGLTLGSSYDIVYRVREEDDRWSPVHVSHADPDHDLLQVYLTPHKGGLYATWMTNITYELEPPIGTITVWDVVVAPLYVLPNPLSGVSVSHRWQRTIKFLGPADVIRFRVVRDAFPMDGAELRVVVKDPGGRIEASFEGRTDADGRIEFDHTFGASGNYSLNLEVNGHTLGEMGMIVAPPPPGHLGQLLVALLFVALAALAMALAGWAFVRRRGVVRGRKVTREVRPPRAKSLLWRWASKALTRVVRNRYAQGFLQMPLFVLFMLSIFLGFFGTQDPQSNFTSMVGWAYYLAGMLLLYFLFGRLWCYFEACGFVDTWAKNLLKRRRWHEWPWWLRNLWPGFFILLAGFWVEIVLSIDLYPWAVALFMVVTILINLVISVNYGKRTYCRFVCRDGVVEELIARYSILRIGVRTRPDSVSHGDVCIWKDEERRPGYCSMCFTCVQNDPTVREATVEPAIRTFAEDVYKPQAVHRDEAMAAVVLMGISIPYMLGLTKAWWIGLFEASQGVAMPLGTEASVSLGVLLAVATVSVDLWAFRRWPETLTTPRRALVVIIEAMLLSEFFLFALGGGPGRLVALRSFIVLGCFVLPFAVVWAGEWVIVRLTRNARGESPWRLLERYGLVFIPIFLGVLVARNIPIIGMWGWAAWDVIKATFADFPGGAAAVEPRPFIDPSLHFALGVLALTIGVMVGAYAALQLSRRLYKEDGNALIAFGVHTVSLFSFAGLFVLILALPPF